MNLVRSFAGLPELISAIERNDSNAVRNELQLASETFPNFGRLYVADNEGHAWSSYPDAAFGPALNPQQREWLALLNKKGSRSFREFIIQAALPGQGLLPWRCRSWTKAKKQLAILVCEYPMDEITARLRQLTPGGSGIVFILDPNGTAAAHPRLFALSRQHDEYLGLPPVQKAREGTHNSPSTWTCHSIQNGGNLPTRQRAGQALGGGRRAADPAEAYATIQQAGLQIGSAAAVLAVGAMAIVTVLGRSNERNRELNLTLSQSNDQLKRERFLIDTLMDTIPTVFISRI